MGTATEDSSNGHEVVATIYIAGRGSRSRVGDSIGAVVVKAWAHAFPPGATVLDLGSGPGEPSTRILQEAGLTTYAVDASPTMVAAFRERFPGVPIERKSVEGSEFFNRTFRGVLAWGLLFLLDPAAQALVIAKVARARATGALSLHGTPAALGMVGRHDWGPVAIPRRAHVCALAARCWPDVGRRRPGRGREPLLRCREAVVRISAAVRKYQTMRIQLLGTGSPNPLPERQGSAVLLSHNQEHFLFDAGRGVTTQLVRAGLAPHQLSAIVLTHHHYDHIGNLGDLLLTAWHGGSSSLPVIGPAGTERIVQALFDQVYEREIRFSLALAQATATLKTDIHQVVQVTPISPAQSYRQGDWQIVAAAVDHGRRLGLTYEDWPCLAYRIEVNGKSIVISGDTVACASLIELASGADVLVQCCFLADAELTTPARQLLADLVIATSGQAGKIAAQAGVKMLVLTHFSGTDPDELAAIEADVRRDYAGSVYLGTDLLSIEV